MSPSAASRDSTPVIHWGVDARTFPGERESGDLHVVMPYQGGALVAVIDGLGHGSGAAAAARIAAHVLGANATEPVTPLIQRCHEELRGTRGVVLSLASFNAEDDTMTWLGVGNVEGVLFHAEGGISREPLLLRGGVVGYQLPPLRPATLPVVRGDMLILATDGIGSRFADESPLDRDPSSVAQDILFRYGKTTDDALVLVARYEGRS